MLHNNWVFSPFFYIGFSSFFAVEYSWPSINTQKLDSCIVVIKNTSFVWSIFVLNKFENWFLFCFSLFRSQRRRTCMGSETNYIVAMHQKKNITSRASCGAKSWFLPLFLVHSKDMDVVFSFPAWKMSHLEQIGPRVNLAIQSLPTTVLLGEKKTQKRNNVRFKE